MVVSLESGRNPLSPQDVAGIEQQLDPLCLDQIEDTALRDLLITANGAISIDTAWPVAQRTVVKLINRVPGFEPGVLGVSAQGIFGILYSGVVGFVAIPNKPENEKGFNKEHVLALVAYLDTRKTLPSDAGLGPSRRKVSESTIKRLGVEHPLAQLLMDKDKDERGGLSSIDEQRYAKEVTIVDLKNWLAVVSGLDPLEDLSMARLFLVNPPSSRLVIPVIVDVIRKIATGSPSQKVEDRGGIANKQFETYLKICLSKFDANPEITTFAQLWQMAEKALRT